MNGTTDIATGLRVPLQIPLDSKQIITSEALLSNLGIGDNLAYTYYDGLVVTCLEERTNYEWRQALVGEIGLLPNNFVYPENWIVFGKNYSLLPFNFFDVTLKHLLESKLDKGEFEGDASNLDDRIFELENINIPDAVLKYGEIVITNGVGNIPADTFNWRLNKIEFLNTAAYNFNILEATDGFYRTDLIVGNNTGNYEIIQGEENEIAAAEPDVPEGTIKLTLIPVFGSVISPPVIVPNYDDKFLKRYKFTYKTIQPIFNIGPGEDDYNVIYNNTLDCQIRIWENGYYGKFVKNGAIYPFKSMGAGKVTVMIMNNLVTVNAPNGLVLNKNQQCYLIKDDYNEWTLINPITNRAVVRNIEIDILLLSETVNFEQSICNYILNLPEEERTVFIDGSKVNILVGQKLISNPLFVIFHSTNNGAILWSREGVYNNPNIVLHYSTDSGISWNTILHDYSITYNATNDGYVQIGNNIYSNQFYIYAENLDTGELTGIYRTALGVFIPNPYETPFKNITNPDIYEVINKGTGLIESITPDNLLLIEKYKEITAPGLQEVLNSGSNAEFDNGNSYVRFLGGNPNDRYFEFFIQNGIPYPNTESSYFYTDNNSLEFQNTVSSSSGVIGVYDGSIKLTQAKSGKETYVDFETPVSIGPSTLKFPAPLVGGSYILATLNEAYPNLNFKYPSGFNFRPFNIIEQNGVFSVDKKPFDLISDKVSKMQAYYVDYQNGSNSNNGLSATTAFKTIIYAINTAGARLIYTRGGDIIQSDGFGLISSTSGVEDIFIIKKGIEQTYILNNIMNPVFTLDTDTTYSTPIGSNIVPNVIDYKFINSYGFPSNLLKVATLIDVNATPNSYFIDTNTTTLYLRLEDGRVPDASVFVLKSSSDNRIQKDGGYVYNEGLTYLGGLYAYRHRGITTATAVSVANYFAENCNYLYSEQNGFGTTDNQGVTWLNNCKAYKNKSDGFNYSQGNIYTLSKNIEVNCQSFDNGLNQTITSFHNGSSAHVKHTVIRVGGKYFRNTGPNVIDVFGSHSLNVGVEAFESLGFNDVDNNPTTAGVNFADYGDFGCGTMAGEPATKMWLYACKSKDNRLSFHKPLYLSDGVSLDMSILYVDNSLKLSNIFGDIVYGSFNSSEIIPYVFSNLSSYTTPFYQPTKIRDTAVSSTVTGIAVDTEVKSYFIPAKTLNVNDILDVIVEVNKTGAVGTGTYKVWKNTANSFAGATQIATFTTVAANLMTKMSRQFTLRSNLLFGNSFTTSLISDIISTSTAFNNTIFDTEVDNYIFVSIALAGAADTAFVSSVKINN
jgi:hypothetical protein